MATVPVSLVVALAVAVATPPVVVVVVVVGVACGGDGDCNCCDGCCCWNVVVGGVVVVGIVVAEGVVSIADILYSWQWILWRHYQFFYSYHKKLDTSINVSLIRLNPDMMDCRDPALSICINGCCCCCCCC